MRPVTFRSKATPKIGTRTSSSYTPHVDVAPADRPLILVAPRWEEAKPLLSETLSPNEEIASVFVDAILAAGGLPLQMSITEDVDVIRHYVEIADGIAIPGGPDVNPKRWGDERPYDPTLCCEIRDRFEFKLVNEVLRAKKPLFTTSRVTLRLNVASVGSLCFDVPSLGAREELLNGVGNLLGMLMTFLGGAWMPLSLMGPAVQTVAHFVPTYWVNDAIGKALASDLTSAMLGDIACDLGVTVLFAVAIAAAGLALSRTKSRA